MLIDMKKMGGGGIFEAIFVIFTLSKFEKHK